MVILAKQTMRIFPKEKIGICELEGEKGSFGFNGKLWKQAWCVCNNFKSSTNSNLTTSNVDFYNPTNLAGLEDCISQVGLSQPNQHKPNQTKPACFFMKSHCFRLMFLLYTLTKSGSPFNQRIFLMPLNCYEDLKSSSLYSSSHISQKGQSPH